MQENQDKNNYFYKFDVETLDVGPNNIIRLSNLLKYQQEAGEQHFADDFGLDYNTLRSRGIVFVTTNMEVLIHKMPKMKDKITINTVSRAIKGVKWFRNYNWYNESGELLIEGCTAFAIVDANTHSLMRPNAIGIEIPTNPDFETTVIMPKKIHINNEMKKVGERVIPFSLLDCNSHLNNSYYADFLTDFNENVDLSKLTSFGIDFAKEAKLGEKIEVFAENIGQDRFFLGMNGENICFRGRFSTKK